MTIVGYVLVLLVGNSDPNIVAEIELPVTTIEQCVDHAETLTTQTTGNAYLGLKYICYPQYAS